MWIEGLGMQLRYTLSRPPYSLEVLSDLHRTIPSNPDLNMTAPGLAEFRLELKVQSLRKSASIASPKPWTLHPHATPEP